MSAAVVNLPRWSIRAPGWALVQIVGWRALALMVQHIRAGAP